MHQEDLKEVQRRIAQLDEDLKNGKIDEAEHKKQKEVFLKMESVIDAVNNLIKAQRN